MVIDDSTGAPAGTVTVAWLEVIPENVAVIVVVPAPAAVASPCVPAELLIVATRLLEEVHVAFDVIFCLVPSENVPVTVNCCVAPLAIVTPVGDIDIETRSGAVTVTDVAPDIPPNVAVTIAKPSAAAVTDPLPFTVMIPAGAAVHAAKFVKFCVAFPERVPVAVNCRAVPAISSGLTGVTLIAVTAAVVIAVVPIAVSKTADIVVVPVEPDVAETRPLSFTDAMPASDELQVTTSVIFCVAEFCSVPVAVSCSVVPGAIVGWLGVTATVERGETVIRVEAAFVPEAAVIVVEPELTSDDAVTRP